MRLSSRSGLLANSSAAIVHVPSPLLVPKFKFEPSGMFAMVTESVSEPSRSVSDAEISSDIAVSSAPVTLPVARSGSSASSVGSVTPSTSMVTVAVDSPPLPSVIV